MKNSVMTIFIIIWSIWFISEILLNRLFRSGTGDKRNQDRGTLRIIWITIGVANSLGILAAIFIKIPISRIVIVPYIGLVLIIFGMIFRIISILSLGKLFTVDVTIRDNHKIKKNGVYRLIRHPSYLGSILSFIGFGISLNNWISLLIISILVTITMLNRIIVEERILTEQFGIEYLDYMKKTYRLVPWIY
ncbi:isoprenylcysteine carboxylmethyltransferase family protein [bacterium]|nr:MAG: isoprenylcysteine carboxylmethyltransferase family protein [bacterium]